MQKIAIIITCHNRVKYTLSALRCLTEAHSACNTRFEMDIYLTDDGSSDGTSEIVHKHYPKITITRGDGGLYWVGGMRVSWMISVKNKYDGYLLLNDDTFITNNTFTDIFKAAEYSEKTFKCPGIYVGSTKDSRSNKISYGGAIIKNRLLFKYKHLAPNGSYQVCDLANCNVTYVSHNVVERIGIFSSKYLHGVADYAYSQEAKRNGIPLFVMPNYCGVCDISDKDVNQKLLEYDIWRRIEYLFDPKGLAFMDNLRFMLGYFPVRFPLVFIAGWTKILFPNIYVNFRNIFNSISFKSQNL